MYQVSIALLYLVRNTDIDDLRECKKIRPFDFLEVPGLFIMTSHQWGTAMTS